MAMPYHEPPESLSPEVREMHRAISSLIEELEAVNWYHQRADVTADPELKAVLEHNRDEEIEHACMALEWIRRQMPQFDSDLRTYLFARGSITAVEEGAAGEGGADTGGNPGGDLGIGSMKQ